MVTCTNARCPPIALCPDCRATWASSRTAEYWKHCVMHWDIRSIDRHRHRLPFKLTTQERSSINSHRCLASIVAKHQCDIIELCSWVVDVTFPDVDRWCVVEGGPVVLCNTHLASLSALVIELRFPNVCKPTTAYDIKSG
jgi:hypothetical protein